MSRGIDCSGTDEIVCPHCGHEESDSWEYGDDDIGLLYCEVCEKGFCAERYIEVTYSTEKAIYGTCAQCNKKNMVIEYWNSSHGKYRDLCVSCGDKEKERQIRLYSESLRKDIV